MSSSLPLDQDKSNLKTVACDYAQTLQDYLDGKIKAIILEDKYSAIVDGNTRLFGLFYGNKIFELFSTLLHCHDPNIERRKDEPYLIGDEELRPAAEEFLAILKNLCRDI